MKFARFMYLIKNIISSLTVQYPNAERMLPVFLPLIKILLFAIFDLKICNILATKNTRVTECENGVNRFHSSTLKHLWNILMFRQIMNALYKV